MTARPLGKMAGEIRLAYGLSGNGREFAEVLEDRGILLARVNLSDVLQNEYAREFSAELGQRLPAELHFGDVVAVDRYGSVHLLNERTTGDNAGGGAKNI